MQLASISHAPPACNPQTNSAITRLNVTGLRLARAGTHIADVPDFALGAGETLAVVGPSGCGKTTALMALSLMHRPAAGDITIDGTRPWTLRASARDQFRGRNIGLIFQSFHLVDALSVRANVALAAHCARSTSDPKRLDYLLTRLGLAEIAGRRVDRISHGQAQRVAVARALMNRPALILADEPTSALDNRNAEALLVLLGDCAKEENAALLVTSHDERVLGAVSRTISLGGLT
ncbi:MAG TPA: ATP-binding cassette domain-containing protein [Rhizomicrobium sp.]|jgi:putative ABC transport system ATP-binding protein